MSEPVSGVIEGEPRLHYLQWNPAAPAAIVLLHGNSANAWWWRGFAERLDPRRYRAIALDLRGHGDSGWVRPAAYAPEDYAADALRALEALQVRRPVMVGHSMGGIATVAFAARYPQAARAAVAVDIAVTSSPRRNRYLARLKALPTVVYPDLAMARARFRLMPDEGGIPPEVIAEIAERSLTRLADGRYTMKFDRESFFGSDGLDVPAALASLRIPTLLVRAGMSRIMTADAAARAAASNPLVELIEIPATHHHLPLERPDLLADAIVGFIERLG
jgi:pimeloyl-ACP methyl ester carboxylesterase